MTALERITEWQKLACNTAGGRRRYNAMAAALTAVLELHKRSPFLGEPGDPECPHDEDYEGDRHFYSTDDMWLCEDTAGEESTCQQCYEQNDLNDPPEWPCPTVAAIETALEATA